MFGRLLVSSIIFRLTAAQFFLYPPISPAYLASSLNISRDCLNTLNTTLPACDPTLTSMVGSIDDFLWVDDNVTAICSGNCTNQINSWNFDVQYYCYGQTLNVGGKLVPADSVSGRYLDNIYLACLPSSDGSWCLTKSLNWQGSDIVRPDCSVTPSDPQCSNATNVNPANQRLANLYGNDILCDTCFINMLKARVQSPFLPDTDYSEFLVDQLQDVADICNVTNLGAISTRALFSYSIAASTTSQVFGNATTSTMTSVSASATCSGQVISGSAKKRAAEYANVHNREVLEKRQTSNCDALSQKYGVATGDLQTATNSATCTITGSICVPSACSLQVVPSNATCDSLAASLSTANMTVTTQQFLGWNRNIMGLCNAVTPGQYYCVGAPGGTYKVAPPPLGTDANAGNQQRGGQGGVVTPTTTVSSTVNSVSQAAGPTATQSGIAKNCNNYAQAKSGDDCYDFAVNHSITPAQLYQWNTILGPNGQNCSLQFQAQEYYCIGVANSTTITTTTTTSAAGAPGPTQSGIISSCNKYATPPDGQGCYDFATANNITPSQLYYWNSVLGPNGSNCGTQFQKGEYYCVGVSGSTAVPTTTTSATRSTPSPVQSGIASNCNKYALPKSGEGCYDFANDNSITTTQLYTWNPVLGNNGQNCGTQFQAGEYYCVGVSS